MGRRPCVLELCEEFFAMEITPAEFCLLWEQQ
jgi:hypothetical protein